VITSNHSRQTSNKKTIFIFNMRPYPALPLITFVFILLLAISCKKKDPPPPPPPPKSSEKAITSFVFKSADNGTQILHNIAGVIGTDTIIVQVNQGVSVSNFIPAINYTGVSISPASAIAQNFNNLVNYTVTAEDGSTKSYVVKVVFLRANQKVYIAGADGNVYAINAGNGTQLWKYTTGGPIYSSPLLVDNTIYIGSMDKYLYALDAATGAMKWKYLTGAPIRDESPVVSNGVAFVSSTNGYPDGYVYAINTASGTLKWSKQIALPNSPVVAGGKLYVNSLGGSFYALDENNGNVVWSKTIGLTSSHHAVVNNRIYIATQGSGTPYQLRCVDAGNGNILWSTPCLSSVTGPTIDNGTVYISKAVGTEQCVEAFNSTDGIFKWRDTLLHVGSINNPVQSCPFALDSLVFPGFHHGNLVTFKTNGTIAWQYGPANDGWFSNPVAANRMVYIGSNDNYLHAVDATNGTMFWKFPTSGAVYSGACLIDSDNNIIHAGSSGAKN
jgi:outer membrane protein assembly factor BamB